MDQRRGGHARAAARRRRVARRHPWPARAPCTAARRRAARPARRPGGRGRAGRRGGRAPPRVAAPAAPAARGRGRFGELRARARAARLAAARARAGRLRHRGVGGAQRRARPPRPRREPDRGGGGGGGRARRGRARGVLGPRPASTAASPRWPTSTPGSRTCASSSPPPRSRPTRPCTRCAAIATGSTSIPDVSPSSSVASPRWWRRRASTACSPRSCLRSRSSGASGSTPWKRPPTRRAWPRRRRLRRRPTTPRRGS